MPQQMATSRFKWLQDSVAPGFIRFRLGMWHGGAAADAEQRRSAAAQQAAVTARTPAVVNPNSAGITGGKDSNSSGSSRGRKLRNANGTAYSSNTDKGETTVEEDENGGAAAVVAVAASALAAPSTFCADRAAASAAAVGIAEESEGSAQLHHEGGGEQSHCRTTSAAAAEKAAAPSSSAAVGSAAAAATAAAVEAEVPPRPATWAEVLALVGQEQQEQQEQQPPPSISSSFRASLTQCLLRSEFGATALFFECAPVRQDVLATAPFEFVLSSAASLLHGVQEDPQPFRKQLAAAVALKQKDGGGPLLVTAFPNLGRDAVLVCPTGLSSSSSSSGGTKKITKADVNAAVTAAAGKKHAHLASFLRHGTEEEADALWRETFAQLLRELGERARGGNKQQWTWLSTHGGGVSWLHMRIDSVPK